MPLVTVKLTEGVFTERQKHDLAARLTDVMITFEGSEAFREVAWVLIEENPTRWLAHRRSAILRATHRDGRPQPVKSRLRGHRRHSDHPGGPGCPGPVRTGDPPRRGAG